MTRRTNAKLVKNKVALTEYSEGTYSSGDKLFLQSGIAGFFLTREELKDVFDILNYYLNIESFQSCAIEIDNERIPAIPTERENTNA
jgi:hypothetical protein